MTAEELDKALATACGVSVEDLNLQVKMQVSGNLTASLPVVVSKLKRARKATGQKLDSSYKRDSLERVEYANPWPAMRTKHETLVARMCQANPESIDLDALAQAMVSEYLDQKNYGLVRVLPSVVVAELVQDAASVSKFIGPQTDAALVRFGRSKQEYATDYAKMQVLRPNGNSKTTKEELKAWRIQRQPQTGQRPVTLLPRRSK